MKKQIVYPGFITRIFSTLIDFCVIMVIFSPPLSFISLKFSGYIFSDLLNSLDGRERISFIEIMNDYTLAQHITWQNLLLYLSLVTFLNITSMGVYFIGCWSKLGTTPGKMILQMRIVDGDSYLKPTLAQAFKRFFWCFLFIFGIWFIPLNSKGKALHDKMSGTLVIKN